MKDDLDLAAWDAPFPTTTTDALADAVIARVREPDVASPVELEPPRRRMRWLAGGGALVAAAAGVAIFVWGVDRAPRDGSGTISGEGAHHLDLGPTVVDLDPGAELHWHRTGERIDATLDKGAAQWSVGANDTLALAAPLAQAHVTATNARMRVEVPMLSPYAKIIGTSATTAVVASLLTVTVYEGHARVERGNETFFVTPGAPYNVTPVPLKEPLDVTMVGSSVPRLGVQPAVPPPFGAVLTFDPGPGRVAAPPIVAGPLPEFAAVTGDDESDHRFDQIPKLLGDYLRTQCPSDRDEELAIELALTADGRVSAASITALVEGKAVHRTCSEAAAQHVHFPAMKSRGWWGIATGKGGRGCEAPDDAIEYAASTYAAGYPGIALARLERALGCRPDHDASRAAMTRAAALYACRAKRVDKAQAYYAQLDARFRTQIEQACLQEGIELKKQP